MGSGVSVPGSVDEALAKGFSQEDIDAYLAAQKKGNDGPPSVAAAAPALPALSSASSVFALKSTKHVTVKAEELDKADQKFATGKWCEPKDFEVLSKLHAYRLKVRHLSAAPRSIFIQIDFCLFIGVS